MTDTQHPFVPGARVAVRERYGNDITEGFVDKAYKSGRFTLRGSSQQWRPWQTHLGDRTWSATETGSGWGRRSLDIWDESTHTEICAQIDAKRARNRWGNIRRKIEGVRDPTNALCDAIEAALSLENAPVSA